MRSRNGFTLIELMIVVAIIAILAAIAISQYQDYVIRAQIAEGASLAEGTKSAVVDFYNKAGRFPNSTCLSSNASVGLAQPASIVGTYVSQVTVAGEGCPPPLGAGSIVAEFSSSILHTLSGSIKVANTDQFGYINQGDGLASQIRRIGGCAAIVSGHGCRGRFSSSVRRGFGCRSAARTAF